MDSFQQDTNPGTEKKKKGGRNNNKWAGIILLAVGVILFLNALGANLPGWLLSWPMGIIVVGLAIGSSTRFRDLTWVVITGVGVFFLLGRQFPDLDVYRYILPVIFIAVGLIVLYGSRSQWFKGSKNKDTIKYGLINDDAGAKTEDQTLEMISIFGGIKKVVYNKSFLGGEIVTIFGGGEVNLMQADFNGTILIEVVQLFGGVKLIVPSHWEVSTSEAVAVFGGIDDKRNAQAITDPGKKLIIRGTTIFGGLEIRSY